MERVDKQRISAYCKQGLYPLLTAILGFLFCFVIIVLTYFTYQTAVGNLNFCTLWTDIPGRLTILIMCCYISGICGILPLPDSCRLNWLPEPFLLYKLESWRSLFRSLYIHMFSYIVQRFLFTARNGSETSPLRGSDERFYECSPTSGAVPILRAALFDNTSVTSENSEPSLTDISISRKSEHTPVAHCSTSAGISEPTLLVNTSTQIVDFVGLPTGISGAEDKEINSSEEFFSFDSPIGGHIVPMVKGKTSKQPYIPDSSISDLESSTDTRNKEKNDLSEIVSKSPESDTDRVKVMFEHLEEEDTPPRTPDIDTPLPNYPRFPWGLLKEKKTPLLAKFLHKRNLRIDRSEAKKYTRRQEVKKADDNGDLKLPSDEESSNEWLTDSDEFNPIGNRPLRLPPLLEPKPRFRAKTTPGNLRKDHRVRRHRRSTSDIPRKKQESCVVSLRMYEFGDTLEKSKTKDEDTKCCDESPSFQFKLDRVKTMLMRFGRNRQTEFEKSTASTSRQIEDLEAGRVSDMDDMNAYLSEEEESKTPTYSEERDGGHFIGRPTDKSGEDSYFENV